MNVLLSVSCRTHVCVAFCPWPQPKPANTPTPPRPQGQPSPSIVVQQPPAVYGQTVCFPQMYPLTPVSPGVQVRPATSRGSAASHLTSSRLVSASHTSRAPTHPSASLHQPSQTLQITFDVCTPLYLPRLQDGTQLSVVSYNFMSCIYFWLSAIANAR